MQAVDGDFRRLAFPLREGSRQLGTLLVPADLPEATLARLQERVVPSLEALLGAAIERDELLSNRVEAAALRRTDVLKTALLRAVSHDLRSPLTAILNAAGPLQSDTITEEERSELAAVITQEARRLSRLIDNLLDLSRLEAGAAEPQRDWCDLREVIHSAVEELGLPDDTFQLQLAQELPLIKADSSQLQRAFVNLLGNSARYSGGHPVLVRAQPLHNRIMVRVVDRGPGIPPAQQERVFEPFYTAGTQRTGHRGSGPRPRDRARLHRGERRARVGGVAAAPGHHVRARAAARAGDRRRAAGARSRTCRHDVTASRGRVLVCDDESQILRALRVVLREADYEVVPGLDRRRGARRRRGAAARRRDHRHRAAGRRRRRGRPPDPRVVADPDPRAVRDRRGGREGARAAGGRGRLRDEAVRPEGAGRAPGGGAAARRRRPRSCP